MMTRRALLLTAMILCSLASCSQSQQDIRIEAYSFLNQVFADTSTDDFLQDSIIFLSDANTLPPPNLWDFNNTTDYVADLFGIEDKEFIRGQLKNRNKIILNKLKAKNVWVVLSSQLEHSSDYDEYFKKQGIQKPNGLYTISTPVFSPNLDKAYFRLGYICGGHCGGTEDRYYEKENGKWTLKEVVGGSMY